MEGYKYPVFFEVPSLDPAQKEKLEKYFQVRRKSGGGDCGPIHNVGDNVYKIAFIDRTVQERVLQKAHVLEMPGGPLSLTLRDSLEPPPTTTSPVSSQEPPPQQPPSQQSGASTTTTSQSAVRSPTTTTSPVSSQEPPPTTTSPDSSQEVRPDYTVQLHLYSACLVT
ncbi:unnamed protein product [Oncorhynchus mykiss]|uniref:PAR14-like first RRM domain-containing protein n=1 Tax=Oncorhynchus mykiss TaxID=8022 RepID=A0A060XLK5_ONCMY|nr:unnamed protein product [Oncorhynchus mykiss]